MRRKTTAADRSFANHKRYQGKRQMLRIKHNDTVILYLRASRRHSGPGIPTDLSWFDPDIIYHVFETGNRPLAVIAGHVYRVVHIFWPGEN